MRKIIVFGANGQLGNCFQKIEDNYKRDFTFIFLDSSDVDITDESQVEEAFQYHKPQFCINAAAYTAVDGAEADEENAYLVNAEAVGYIAEMCKKYNSVLVHVSTDYVFDGETNLPYDEDDFTNPMGVYGASKLKGEELALENNLQTIILRTSWLYSEFNKNFVKTMLNLFAQKDEIGVVADQYGQPTNANDLAEAIMQMISADNKKFGIYHFSNYPETTWFNFASAIAEISGANTKINPLSTDQYPTAAKRPKRSTMCLDKIETDYHIEPKYWENSLEDVLKILKENA